MKHAFNYLGIDLYFSDHDWSGISILLENEFWKDVPEYEGFYQASTLGRVKSLPRSYVNDYHLTPLDFRGKILKPFVDKRGYLKYKFFKKGIKEKTLFGHRIIGFTFIHNHEKLPQINHKDGIKHNNRTSNLEWTTCKDNIRHAWNNGLYKPQLGVRRNAKIPEERFKELKKLIERGVKYKCIKPLFNLKTIDPIIKIKKRMGWISPTDAKPRLEKETVNKIRQDFKNNMSIPQISNKYGIHYQTAYDICKNKTYRYG